MSHVSSGALQRAVAFGHEIRDLASILVATENKLKLSFSNLKGPENKAKVFGNLLASEASLETFFASKFLAESKNGQDIEVMVFCNDTHIKQLFAALPMIVGKMVDDQECALAVARNEMLLRVLVDICTDHLAIFHSRKLRLLERLAVILLLANDSSYKNPEPPIKALIEVLSQRDSCILACTYAARKTFKHTFILHKQSELTQYGFEYFVGRIFKRLPVCEVSILQLLANDDPTNQAKAYRRMIVLFLKSLMHRYLKHLDKIWCFNGFEHCTLFDKNKARMLLDNFAQFLDPENSSLSLKVSQIFLARFPNSPLHQTASNAIDTKKLDLLPYVLFSIPKEKILELAKFLLAHDRLFPATATKSIVDNIGFYYVKTLDIFVRAKDFRLVEQETASSYLIDTLIKIEASSLMPNFHKQHSLLVNLQNTNIFSDSQFDRLLNHLYLSPDHSLSQKQVTWDKHVTEEVFNMLQRQLAYLKTQLASANTIMNQINAMRSSMESWTNFDQLARTSVISRYLFPIFKTRPLEVWLKFKANPETGILEYLKLLKGKKVQVLKKSTVYDENFQIREKGVEYLEVTRFKDFLYFVCKRNVLYSAMKNPQLESDVMEVLDEFYDEIYEIASHLDLAKRFGIDTQLFQTSIQEYIFNEFLLYLHRTSAVLSKVITLPTTDELQTTYPLPPKPYASLLKIIQQPVKLDHHLKLQHLSSTCSYKDLKAFLRKFPNRLAKFTERVLNMPSPTLDVA
jgi:hypothetical protein